MPAAAPPVDPVTGGRRARLRVLTVARWYPSHDWPGRGSFVADLVRSTARAGVDARVVSFDRVLVRGRLEARDAVLAAARDAYEQVATPTALFVPTTRWAAGVPVARIPVVRRPGASDPDALIDDHLVALQPFVRRLVAAWRPDVIHAHTGIPDGIVAAAVGRRFGIPVVVSEHLSTIESELAEPVALERYRQLLEPGVALHGVSPSLAVRVAALLEVPAERIGVLPNPVVDGSFPMADRPGPDPNELLWVGSLGEHKGIDVLLEAFSLLRGRRPGLRLRLVGGERSPGERQHWESLAASLGIDAGVTFDGWLPRGQVATAMARAAVFVHPSPSETFGVAAAEAILTGLPVASRQSGGVPWIIGLAGGFGRAAEGDDAAAFARAIEMTLDGPLAVDATTARSRLVDAIGERRVAQQVIGVYRRVMAGPGRDGRDGPEDDRAPRASGGRSEITGSAGTPHLLLATGRDQALRLVVALPVELQRRLVLVLPAPIQGDTAASRPIGGTAVELAEADPIPPPTRRPTGRSPLTRLRGALWRPAPSGEQLLVRAVLDVARRTRSGPGPVRVVALDAPAAALVARLDPRMVELAPGVLRWLVDRWESASPRHE